jgi:hypothetical protein
MSSWRSAELVEHRDILPSTLQERSALASLALRFQTAVSSGTAGQQL